MSKTLKIKTLTPVHIGSGKKLSYFDYMIYGNYYYRINTDRCFDWIFANKEGSKDKIDEWITKANYQLQESKGQGGNTLSVFGFLSFLKSDALKSSLEKEIVSNSKYYHYKMPCHKKVSKELSEIINTAGNQLYIPGSSIKGMLRTILMNNVILEQDDNNKSSKLIKNCLELEAEIGKEIEKNENYWNQRINNENHDREKNKLLKNKEKDIDRILFRKKIEFSKKVSYFENSVFNCGFRKYDNGEIIYSDAKYDILRFLHITDTNTLPVEEAGRIAFTGMYHNNGNMGEAPPPFEAIKEDIEFESRITIDVAGLKAVANNKDRNQWLDFDNKLQSIFSVDNYFLKNNSNEDAENEIIKFFMSAINHFSEFLIKKEEYWVMVEKNFTQYKGAKVLDDFYIENIKYGAAVKLGWASSFPAVTVFDALTFEDDSKYITKEPYIKALKAMKIMKANNLEEFPTTHRFENYDNNTINPIGWVSIDIE